MAYLDARGLPTVTIEAALAWAQQAPKSPAGRVTTIGPRRMTAARGFARYLSGIDAGTEVPPLGLMPRRAPWRRPFIYSAADIDALLELARQTIVSPLRAATYQTLIGLLAASGLRIGEAIKLDRSDVDWAQGVLLIRESKFGKSRLVPLHPSSMQALEGYARLRDQLQPRPAEPAFFVSLNRQAAALRGRATDVPAAHRQRRHRRRRALAAAAARPEALGGRLGYAPCRGVSAARGGGARVVVRIISLRRRHRPSESSQEIRDESKVQSGKASGVSGS